MDITFKKLKDDLKQELFPAYLADNLVVAVDKFFVEALIDLQWMVKCLQFSNTDVVSFCNTYFDCGKTILDLPRGIIQRVYTVAGTETDYCDPVIYQQDTFENVEGYSADVASTAPDVDADKPALPLGIRYANASSDSAGGRARAGKWCIHRGRLYMSPWIQSNEKVVIVWDGIKRSWDNSDLILNGSDADFQKAVKLYVQASYARDYDKDGNAFGMYLSQYEDARAELHYRCREETRLRENKITMFPVAPTPAQLEDDED